MKGLIFSASVTSNNPSTFLLSSGDCVMDPGTHIKILITIYFHISMQYKLIIVRTGVCRGISIKTFDFKGGNAASL